MISDVFIETRTVVRLNVASAAQWFAFADDDQKTQFLVAVADYLKDLDQKVLARHWDAVGGHLRWCSCSSDGARDMIRAIAAAMETSDHGRNGLLATPTAGAPSAGGKGAAALSLSGAAAPPRVEV